MTFAHRRRNSTPRASDGRRSGVFASASLIALLTIGGSVVLTASPAAAHDELLSTSPNESAILQGAPVEISLTFTGELQTSESATSIEVITEDGANVAEGAPKIVDATVTQDLSNQPVVGEVTVRWRVLSSDGHPASNEYTFTVEAAAASTTNPTPTSTTTPAENTTELPTPMSESGYGDIHTQPNTRLDALPMLAVFGGVALLGGAALVMILAGRDRRRRDRLSQEKEVYVDES